MTRSQSLQRYSLMLLLATLAFSKALAEITSTLLILGWLWPGAHPWPTRRWWSQWRAAPLTPALATFLVISALSIGVSQARDISLHGFTGKTLEYVCLCWAVTSLVLVDDDWRFWWLGLAVGSLCVVLDVAWQQVHGTDLRGHLLQIYTRVTGPFENPNDLAAYVMVTIPILVGGAWGVARTHRWCYRGGITLAIALTIVLLATHSYVSWLGLGFAGLILLCGWIDGAPATLWAVLGGAVAMISMITWGVLTRWISAYPIFGPGVEDRRFMWQAAWRMWRDRWWLGHGVNTFMSQYLHYWVGGEHTPRYAHNCYLQMGAEEGLVGLAAFMWVLGAILWSGVRGVSQRTHEPHRSLLLGLLAAVVAFLVQSGFDTNFYSLRSATFLWAIAGILIGLVYRPRES